MPRTAADYAHYEAACPSSRPVIQSRGKGGDIMFNERYDALKYALKLVEKILENPAVNAHPNATTANEIADFVETFADRMTKKN